MTTKSANTKIFVVGGGTGGHLFPAIAVVEELKKRGYDSNLITDTRCARYLKNHQELQTHIINLPKMKYGIFGKLFMLLYIYKAVVQMLLLFCRKRPALVMGCGGYPAFAPVFCAYLLRVPILLHEQNCFLGKVNRWFSTKAKKLLLTFKDTSNIPSCVNSQNIIVTGNPVRAELKTKVAVKDFKARPFKILVTGGSQGAAAFSSLIPEALKIVKESVSDFEITQQVRAEDVSRIKEFYKIQKIPNKIESFFYNMPELLADTHLFIGRAGASTLSELIAFAKPSILIPYPFAAANHQEFNAKVIEKNGGGWCYDQNTTTPQMLADKILEIMSDNGILIRAAKSLETLQKDSTNIIADTVEEIIR